MSPYATEADSSDGPSPSLLESVSITKDPSVLSFCNFAGFLFPFGSCSLVLLDASSTLFMLVALVSSSPPFVVCPSSSFTLSTHVRLPRQYPQLDADRPQIRAMLGVSLIGSSS